MTVAPCGKRCRVSLRSTVTYGVSRIGGRLIIYPFALMLLQGSVWQKIPKKVIIKDQIPRTPTGKILKRLLREKFN